MILFVFYLLVRRLLELAVLLGRSEASKEIPSCRSSACPSSGTRQADWVIGGLAILLFVLFVVLVGGPRLFVKNTEGLSPDQRLKAENDLRTTLVQALAGLGVGAGVIVTYRTYRQNQIEQERTYRQRLTEEERRQAEQDRTHRQTLAEQDRTHERELYAKAVEQLGHERAAVRRRPRVCAEPPPRPLRARR